MKTILSGIFLLLALPAWAAGPIAGEVNCDKGVDIARVQALVKKTTAALKSDQARVLAEINRGDKQWKDGDYYVAVLQGTKVLAHGYLSSAVGLDAGDPMYEKRYPWVKTGLQVATEKGEGCIQYQFLNPAKAGQVEDKVTYVMRVNGTLWAASGTYLIRK